MKIVIASHGAFASGIKSSLSVLLGKVDHVTAIDSYLDEESLEDKIDEYFQAIPDSEQVIMLSDLYGGSVNQKMYLRLVRPNTFLIAGVNLALVLELALKTNSLTLEDINKIVADSRKGLKLVDFQSTSVEKEDFFGVS